MNAGWLRYAGCTLDGTVLFKAATADELGSAVARYFDATAAVTAHADRRPHLAYTFDQRPGMPYPYTTWKRLETAIPGVVGTPWATFDEVAEEVRKNAAAGPVEAPAPDLLGALEAITRTFLDGSHYETQNPYTRPVVKDALRAIAQAKGLPAEAWMNAIDMTKEQAK